MDGWRCIPEKLTSAKHAVFYAAQDVLDFLTTRLRFYGVERSSAVKRRAGRLKPLQSLVAVGEYFTGARRDR
jgi:hypothetical protein